MGEGPVARGTDRAPGSSPSGLQRAQDGRQHGAQHATGEVTPVPVVDAEPVRWLNAEERRAWLSLVATNMQLMPTLEADLQQHGSVSFFEYQVLAMLSESSEPLTMSELAARTNSSLSRLSHVARKLEERGWIRRSPSTSDARVTMAQMTEPGMRELARVAPMHVESVRRHLLDVLDHRDLAEIGRIGAKILAHLQPDHWVFRDPALAQTDAAPGPGRGVPPRIE